MRDLAHFLGTDEVTVERCEPPDLAAVREYLATLDPAGEPTSSRGDQRASG